MNTETVWSHLNSELIFKRNVHREGSSDRNRSSFGNSRARKQRENVETAYFQNNIYNLFYKKCEINYIICVRNFGLVSEETQARCLYMQLLNMSTHCTYIALNQRQHKRNLGHIPMGRCPVL